MAKELARPIRTARDHKNASALARKALKQAEREPAAERRLQALLDAIDKYDGESGEEDYGDSPEDVEGLLQRRWSDDIPEDA